MGIIEIEILPREKEAWEKPFEEQHKVVEAIWSPSL